MNSISRLRKSIDNIDKKIVGLLNSRVKLVLKIAQLKKAKNEKIFQPDRESEIIKNIYKINQGPLSNEILYKIYREIFSSSLRLQGPIKVSYLGPIGTFTHMATIKSFGSSVPIIPEESISDVFTKVENGQSDYGVVPIENSNEGVVSYTLSMFLDSKLKICGEVYLDVHQNLLSKSNNIKNIKKIYSHPQAFAQCRRWLELNLPRAEIIETTSTACAAKEVSVKKDTAAIGPSIAADIYKLNILAENIEDRQENQTRFLIIGDAENKFRKTGQDKTSIICSVKDKPGALFQLLKPLSENKVNMTKIESMPTRKQPWEYVFFIDFEGHIEDKKIKKMLKQLESRAIFVKILGSYPSAVK